MLTIKMLSDKSLIMTKPVRLYQRQSLVDNMQILINPIYSEEIDLSDYDVTIEYLDPANVVHTESLVKDPELYNDTFMRFTMDVDSKFTFMAGDVTMKLLLTHFDEAENKKYVLKTGELIVPVIKDVDFFAYVDEASLGILENKIMELQAETDKLAAAAEIYAEGVPTDLTLNDEALLQLSINGTPTGDGVQIAKPVEEGDGKDDGVIDLNQAPVDNSTNQIPIVAVVDL